MDELEIKETQEKMESLFSEIKVLSDKIEKSKEKDIGIANLVNAQYFLTISLTKYI